MEEKIIQLKDLQPGSSYLVRARAKNRYDVYSEWSETYTLNIVKDNLKPSIPATPTVNLAGPQKIVVIHNNKTKTNVDLEFDVVSYKVFTNTTQSNTGGTLIHTMSATRPGSGIDSFATINVNAPLAGENGATVYFYVTAVDSAGNESDPSDATTGKPIQYFDSAYISDLTADRIRTGTLQANQQISVGTTAPIIIKSNATSPRGQIYIGTTSNPTGAVGSGYRDTQTAFYVDSTGKFSLKDQLYWDGTTLTIQGVLKVGEAAGDITTISGDKVRTGNLISNNYESNIPGQPQAQSNSFTNAGTWIDLDSGAIYSKGFYITGTGDKDPDGNTIPAGTAVFGGEVFGARGIFSDYITKVSGQDLDSSDGLRFPTLVVESTNTNDGYLVLFKNAGTKSGVEFYVKQNTGDGTGETVQKNWRRASLAHLSGQDWPGGVFRVAAYASSTGKTPGLMHIFAESGETVNNVQTPGEIHIDAEKIYISKLWIKEDYGNENLSNFWKDPDTVTAPSRFFLLGSGTGSGIEVRKKADGTPQVKIKNYEIEGVSAIIDDSKITVNTVEIGKGVGGAGKHGIKIDSSNYWYDPATLGSTDVVFRAGGSASNALTVLKNGTVTFEGTTNPTDGTIKGVLQTTNGFKIGKDVSGTNDGILLNSNNYWYIGNNKTALKVGDANAFMLFEPDGGGTNIGRLTITGTINVTGGNAATTSQLAAKLDSSSFTGINIISAVNSQVLTDNNANGISIGNTISGSNVYPRIATLSHLTFSDTGAGFFLGRDSVDGQYKFFVGDGVNDKLEWNGSGLVVKGNFRTNDADKTRISMQTGNTAAKINFFHEANVGSARVTVKSGTATASTPGTIEIFSGETYTTETGVIWKFSGPTKNTYKQSPYLSFETSATSSRLRLEVPTDFGVVRIEGKDFDVATDTVTFSNSGTQFLSIGDKSTFASTDYVLGKNSDGLLRWFPQSAIGSGGGGTTYQAGVGIEIDTATNPDTIKNTGYRMQGSTTGGTRTSDSNRIGFVSAPSSPQDGDMWVEF